MTVFRRETVPNNLVAQEQSHRRATLLGISVVIVLSIAPVFGHHVSARLANAFGGMEHVGAFCVVALHAVLAPVHGAFHLVLGIGLAYAVFDRWRSWRALNGAVSALESWPAREGEPLWHAAIAAGLDPARLRVVDGLPNPAFTVGLTSPRVYVSSALADALHWGELEAVIAHETAHVLRRDPLRVTAYRFLACTLFWIPALRKLADDLADEVEILADDYAWRDRPLDLASAILSLAEWRQKAVVRGAVGFQRDDLLERRIRRLAGEATPVSSHLTRRSIAGAALALGLVITSGVFGAQPVSTAAVHYRHHCSHGGESPLLHLFCAGFHLATTPLRCPHELAAIPSAGLPAGS